VLGYLIDAVNSMQEKAPTSSVSLALVFAFLDRALKLTERLKRFDLHPKMLERLDSNLATLRDIHATVSRAQQAYQQRTKEKEKEQSTWLAIVIALIIAVAVLSTCGK